MGGFQIRRVRYHGIRNAILYSSYTCSGWTRYPTVFLTISRRRLAGSGRRPKREVPESRTPSARFVYMRRLSFENLTVTHL